MLHRLLAVAAAVGATLACDRRSDPPPPPQDAQAPAPTRNSEPRGPKLPDGLTGAPGASTDATSGLPTRVVHSATGIVLVLVPAGEFRMGSPLVEADRGMDEHEHRRIVEAPFYLGETEVRFVEFLMFVHAAGYITDAERGVEEGGHSQGAFATTPDGQRAWNANACWRNPFPKLDDFELDDEHPVVQVSWNDARSFCEHYGLELPSEARWEYAARCGSTSRFPWGDRPEDAVGLENFADSSYRRRFASANVWFDFDDGSTLISRVKSYQPNAWGLFDMSGNAAEWCADAYTHDYPSDSAGADAVPGSELSDRVQRGGSWLDGPARCRSAQRAAMDPQRRRDFIGFRVAKSIER